MKYLREFNSSDSYETIKEVLMDLKEECIDIGYDVIITEGKFGYNDNYPISFIFPGDSHFERVTGTKCISFETEWEEPRDENYKDEFVIYDGSQLDKSMKIHKRIVRLCESTKEAISRLSSLPIVRNIYIFDTDASQGGVSIIVDTDIQY